MVVSQSHLRRHGRLDRFFNTEFHSRVEDEPAETPVGGTAKRFGLQRTAAGAIVNGLGGDGFWRIGKGRKEVNILRRREWSRQLPKFHGGADLVIKNSRARGVSR